MNRTKGFTLIELLVVIAIIALLIGLLLPALAKAQRNARSLKDKAQIKQIHQAMLVFANDNNDVLPTPGLIDRDANPYAPEGPDTHTIGVGPENVRENTTANLYSCMIAQEYFNPDLLIGPTEVNPVVEEYSNYNYQAYNPGDSTGDDDSYWDRNFKALLSSVNAGDCNTSYSHMALIGQRKKVKWRNTSHENDPMVSTRGTKEGIATGPDYNDSFTLLLHGPKKQWMGNIVYSDNHTDVSETFYPSLVSYEPNFVDGRLTKDNIFEAEFNDYDPEGENTWLSGDAYLLMYIAVTDMMVIPAYERLMSQP